MAEAWQSGLVAFYEASERDDAAYQPFASSVVAGSEQQLGASGFIMSEAAAGVVGPSTWRIGNVKVISIDGSTAIVHGCSYDPGTHYESTGASPPASLGGGAGYTAYITTMLLVRGRWKADNTVTSTMLSTSGAGPCHGF